VFAFCILPLVYFCPSFHSLPSVLVRRGMKNATSVSHFFRCRVTYFLIWRFASFSVGLRFVQFAVFRYGSSRCLQDRSSPIACYFLLVPTICPRRLMMWS
jgi:hypothetical protein